jgi:hypothetical protein
MARSGRPKGYAKTGGRKTGAPNKVTSHVRLIAQQHGQEAIECLAKLMREAESAGDRIRAAGLILDRAHGRPFQQQIVTGDDAGTPVRHVFKWEE